MSAGAALGWPGRVRGRRLSLRAMRPDDPLPDWLPEGERAIAATGAGCRLLDRVAAGDAAYWIRTAGAGRAEVAGALAARVDSSDAGLIWTWLAVGAEWRARGLGGAAVPLLERVAARLGARAARVTVPARNGVALYFWLRLGYQVRAAAPWSLEQGGTWMVRSPIGR